MNELTSDAFKRLSRYYLNFTSRSEKSSLATKDYIVDELYMLWGTLSRNFDLVSISFYDFQLGLISD